MVEPYIRLWLQASQRIRLEEELARLVPRLHGPVEDREQDLQVPLDRSIGNGLGRSLPDRRLAGPGLRRIRVSRRCPLRRRAAKRRLRSWRSDHDLLLERFLDEADRFLLTAEGGTALTPSQSPLIREWAVGQLDRRAPTTPGIQGRCAGFLRFLCFMGSLGSQLLPLSRDHP